MTNLALIAKALLEMTEEMKTVKRNTSGSINVLSAQAIRKRAVKKIQAAGETNELAWSMVWDHNKNFK